MEGRELKNMKGTKWREKDVKDIWWKKDSGPTCPSLGYLSWVYFPPYVWWAKSSYRSQKKACSPFFSPLPTWRLGQTFLMAVFPSSNSHSAIIPLFLCLQDRVLFFWENEMAQWLVVFYFSALSYAYSVFIRINWRLYVSSFWCFKFF